MNRVILTGRCGADAKIKEFDNGKIASVTLATTERAYKTADGREIPEKTVWHALTFKGKLAEVAEKYVKKGTKLFVEGKINYREYTKDDNKVSVTEIIVENMEILTFAEKENNDRPF